MKRSPLPSLLAGLSVILLAGLAIYVSTRIWAGEITDVLTYRHAARMLLEGGTDLYAIDRLPPGTWPYLYPPAFAALVAPVFLLPEGLGNAIWVTLVSGSVIVSFWAMRRLGGLALGQMVLLGACLALPTAWLMVMGQVDALVVGALALAILAEERDRPLMAGALIGLAAAIKVVPALGILPFLALRRWRVAAAAILTAAGLSLLPLPWLIPSTGFLGGLTRLVDLHVAFLRQVLLLGSDQPAAREWLLLPWNGSLPSAALRLVGAPTLGSVLMGLLVLGGTWVARQRRSPGIGVGLVVTAGALGSFVFSTHNLFLFTLPLALAFSRAGALMLFVGFVLVNWANPVLGTAAYLTVWGTCATGALWSSSRAGCQSDEPPIPG